MDPILRPTPAGLYCSGGDFFIDPRQPVDRAVITHAHADHARPGSRKYLCAADGGRILQARLGAGVDIETRRYGEVIRIRDVSLSFHPSGHILGAAQVRIEQSGRICVVSGDAKTEPDPTCAPIEPIRCHTFITESTFGLPIFRWPDPATVLQAINDWWRENRDQGRTSILFAYALGKAQRILAGLDPSIGPILTHGSIENMTRIYRESGVSLPETRRVGEVDDKRLPKSALVVAPPSADQPAWMRRFPQRSRAFASGWMRIRGNRRRRSVDRGFVLSDHSDWQGLVDTIDATGAENIGVTHGYAPELVRWLCENGRHAEVVGTEFDREEHNEEETPKNI